MNQEVRDLNKAAPSHRNTDTKQGRKWRYVNSAVSFLTTGSPNVKQTFHYPLGMPMEKNAKPRTELIFNNEGFDDKFPHLDYIYEGASK